MHYTGEQLCCLKWPYSEWLIEGNVLSVYFFLFCMFTAKKVLRGDKYSFRGWTVVHSRLFASTWLEERTSEKRSCKFDRTLYPASPYHVCSLNGRLTSFSLHVISLRRYLNYFNLFLCSQLVYFQRMNNIQESMSKLDALLSSGMITSDVCDLSILPHTSIFPILPIHIIIFFSQ